MASGRRKGFYLLIIMLLLGGLFTGRASFFHIAYALGGILIASGLLAWLAMRRLEIDRRTFARHVQVGSTIRENFTIRSRSLLPKLWLEIRDHSSLPGHRASHVVPLLWRGGGYRWTAETVALARGVYTLGPITLHSGDPFGLFLPQREVSAVSRVTVYPAAVPLRRLDLPLGALPGEEAQRRRTNAVTTNVAGIRGYASGDSFNRIHWPTTVRQRELMVKKFEVSPRLNAWLFVDFAAESLADSPSVRRSDDGGYALPGAGGSLAASTEEYAVVTAATLARHLLNTDHALGFGAYIPHREVYSPDHSRRHLQRILNTLAVARSLSPYPLAHMLAMEVPRLPRGATLILVTSSIDTEWIRAASLARRKGARPVAAFIDPASFGGQNTDEARLMLRRANIPAWIIRRGDDIGAVLSMRPT